MAPPPPPNAQTGPHQARRLVDIDVNIEFVKRLATVQVLLMWLLVMNLDSINYSVVRKAATVLLLAAAAVADSVQ